MIGAECAVGMPFTKLPGFTGKTYFKPLIKKDSKA